MKRLLALLLCWALPALAAVTSTVAPGPWELFSGSRKVASPFPNLDACEAAARALNKTSSYACRNSVKVAVLVKADPPPAPIDHSHGPVVDMTRLMPPAAGSGELRMRPTTEVPTPLTDFGAFRSECMPSHMATDDPIVYPREPGRSHLHTFFGNTGTNANSTVASLASSGNGTCRGGIANRSGYWVPALVEIADPAKPAVAVAPTSAVFYYKTGYNGITPAQINMLPAGLRMIAGDASNVAPDGHFRWACVGSPEADAMVGQSIQNCPAGSTLFMEVFFPQCWNGVDLDSVDHKSHMAYPVLRACPKTHPIAVPEITFNVRYAVTQSNQPLRWRLASDRYEPVITNGTTTAGHSAHGDWFDGWMPDVKKAWTLGCDAASVDCHSHLSGDGRELY